MGHLRLVLVMLLAACGEVSSASGPDGGSGPDAQAVGPVSVTVGQVFGDALAIEDLTVLLVAPGGGVIATTTDADGRASADDVPAGSTLLVFLRSLPAGAPDGRLTLAVVGVEPGDDIEFADPSPPRTSLGSMTIEFPAEPDAATYRVENGCTAAFPTTETTSLDFDDSCVRAGDFDSFIRAADDTGALLGWLGGEGVFSSGEPIILGGSWSAPEDLSVNLINIPAEARAASGRMTPIISDLEYDGTERAAVDLDSEEVEIRLAAPSEIVESRAVAIEVAPFNNGYGLQVITHRLPADQDSREISLRDELLPWYGAGELDGAARVLRWPRSSGRSPDAQLVSATWIEEGEVVENGIFVLAPPDLTEVVLPALPDEYAEYAPVDPNEINVGVLAAESSRFDGYRPARQRGLEIAGEDSILAEATPGATRLSGSPNAGL